MRTNELRRQTWSVAVSALALMALTIGTAQAAAPSTTAYHFSSHPMISGTVVTVNDRQMVVNTDQGEQVTLELDSRTMAPRDLAPGMVMRVDFLALEDCHLYAQRIIPIRGGMSTNRLQAYANTRDSREAIEYKASAYRGGYRETQINAGTRVIQPQTVGEHSPGVIMTAKPTTSDYQFSTRAVVSGSVLSVNDHWLVVETDQGQKVGLVMDSHTMVPGEVAPGTVLRVEFSQLKDGRYYAKRVTRTRSGVVDREQAYAHTRDSDLLLASNVSDCGFVSAASGNTASTVIERREIVTPAPVVVPDQGVAGEEIETLPQTASNQPLLLLLGLFALGSAGFITVVRGLRNI